MAPKSSSLFSGTSGLGSGISITKFILSSFSELWFWSSDSSGGFNIVVSYDRGGVGVGVENANSALTIKFCFFADGGGVGFTDGGGVGFVGYSERNFSYDGTNLTTMVGTTQSEYTVGALQSTAFNATSDNWILFTMQAATSLEIANMDMMKVFIYG